MNDFTDTPIAPISFLKMFFRRKEFILIPAFAGVVLGICTGILLPKEYKSSTVIMVKESKSDNPLFDKLAVSTTVDQRMTEIRESIFGWNSLVELVKRLDLAEDVKTKIEFEQLIKGLRSKIHIALRSYNILDLAYVGRNPEKTQAIVKNITDIFIDRNILMQNQETADAIKFIEEQLQVYKGKIKSSEISKLQDELDQLLLDSTEKHPRVKELRADLDIKKAALDKENLQYSENIGIDIEINNPIINEIKRALDELESGKEESTEKILPEPGNDYYKVMLIEKLQTVIARDGAINNQIYNMLLRRLETAKITQRLQASKEGTKYIIINPPRVPLRPFKPNKIMVVFIGLFLGVFAGVGLVFAVEFMDRSFLDVEEAKIFLGVPLLGAISKINTKNSLRMVKEKERWLYSLTLAIGVIIIILTVWVSNFLTV